MTTHTTGTRDEWLTARLELLLKAEKELTIASGGAQAIRQPISIVAGACSSVGTATVAPTGRRTRTRRARLVSFTARASCSRNRA